MTAMRGSLRAPIGLPRVLCGRPALTNATRYRLLATTKETDFTKKHSWTAYDGAAKADTFRKVFDGGKPMWEALADLVEHRAQLRVLEAQALRAVPAAAAAQQTQAPTGGGGTMFLGAARGIPVGHQRAGGGGWGGRSGGGRPTPRPAG